MTPIITSLLDTDLYKFTMAQAVFEKHLDTKVSYSLSCRDKSQKLGYLYDDLKDQIKSFINLKFTSAELDYLISLGFKSSFIEFLKTLDLSCVKYVIYPNAEGQLNLSIYGPWTHAIWFEVPVLAMINELHSSYHKDHLGFMGRGTGALDVLAPKIKSLIEYNDKQKSRKEPVLTFSEFGTRRRYSKEIQDVVFSSLANTSYCVGSSNVLLSMKYGTLPIGTMAHEWIQAGQAFTHPLDSQVYMMKEWIDVYGDKYNIALTDTLTSDKFLKDMKVMGDLFSGYRQDSGNPYEWTNNLIRSLFKAKINLKTKTVVFSDNLTIPKAIDLHTEWCNCFKNILFGIGTNLTNDVPGHKALNIVIKLVQVNNRVVAKLSDNPDKAICLDKYYLRYLHDSISIDTNELGKSREEF